MALALASGTSIGGFEVLDVIGRGGFGITYKAIEQRSSKTYAIKEYLPDGMSARAPNGLVSALKGLETTYARGLGAFMTEANILKELPRRKGLVRVRGAFEKFGTAYCVMEFIEGDSLDRMSRRMIERYNNMPAELITDLTLSMCWALDALHTENLIHRDVKPANIMLRRNGEPVLIDFGAARRLSRRGTKETIFTRKYAAIEQFPPEMSGFGRNFEEGPWSDIYSLSVVLYELIAKTSPPDATVRAAALLEGQQDPYVPLERVVQNQNTAGIYPPSLLATIDAGCALMPKERIRGATELAEQIAPGWWNKNQNEVDDAHTTMTDSTEIGSPRGASLGWIVWLGILAVCATVLLFWAYQTFFYEEVF
ncbi:serine/threonine protein kinase [Yoonia algicola]|uniref:Serine/threonine-protein kinase n=1 Tax=Yoonia algicola TaxID=3137368 RepID=A0AAN0M6G8_9RHOB